MTIDDLNDLYLFARVVEAGGFAAAERDTGIPKSRLSRRIAALEKQLGVRLIHRSAHVFNVTDVGQSVYKHARAMTDQAQSAIATVADSLNEPVEPICRSARGAHRYRDSFLHGTAGVRRCGGAPDGDVANGAGGQPGIAGKVQCAGHRG
jgi:hypothetical protein